MDSQEKKLRKYVDPTGELPNEQLKFAEWWLSHKIQLKKSGFFSLVILDIILVLYSLGAWGSYLIFGIQNDAKMAERQILETPNYLAAQNYYQADPPSFSQIQIFESAPGKYDFVIDANNTNPRHLVKLTYKFVYEGGETPLAETIILPGTNRPVVYFGQTNSSYPVNAKFVLQDTKWKRVDPHQVPNVKAYLSEKLDFSTSDLFFFGADMVYNITNRLTFKIKNNSTFGYWETMFYADLYNNGQRVGIFPINLEKFRRGESRDIDFRILTNNINISQVVLQPVINVFDPLVFMRPEE